LKRFVLLAVSAVMLFLAVVCVDFNSALAASEDLKGYKRVAQTDNLSLSYNPDSFAIAVKDKRNGYIWFSSAAERYHFEKSNEYWKNYMSTLLAINYTDLEKNTGGQVKDFLTNKTAQISAEELKNGLRLNCNIDKLSIEIAIEFVLDGDSLLICIPADSISENGNLAIVSIEVLPFFGAADRNTDGYVLFPDGSGAIMRYNNIENAQRENQQLKWYIFGPRNMDNDTYRALKRNMIETAALPVFGVKNENNAFIASLDKGNCNASIGLSAEGNGVDLNRISFELGYRNIFNIILSDIIINGISTTGGSTAAKADRAYENQDYNLRYTFLAGNDADYSGMANAYREYLIDNGRIKQAIESDVIPLAIDFFMGIKEDRLLFDRFIKMTDFQEAQLITEKLLESGVENLQIKFKGWTKGGYGQYPINWPPDNNLGGKNGLRRYAEFANENNIGMFLQVDFMQALSDNGGFSKRSDVVKQGNTLPVTDDDDEWFILNPIVILKRFTSFLRRFFCRDYAGIAFEGLGEMAYKDYNSRNPSLKSDTVETWREIFNQSSEKMRGTAVEGGNAYALEYADFLFNIDIEDSKYYMADETVPFYQMVVHGMIPYTAKPGNLSYDHQLQKLKWVEYGCMPYYELTYAKPQLLKYTEYNKLFSSYYEAWIDPAVEVYKEFNQRLGSIWREKIIKHQKLDENLVRVTYSNGSVVYVNYGESDAEVGGYIIKAKDYYMVMEGRAEQ
jgi:frataxin-like iron-binding protein CyaY